MPDGHIPLHPSPPAQVRGLVPYMEGRIRLLNHQITSTRRGLKNQLKALWWRKVPPPPPLSPVACQSGSPRPMKVKVGFLRWRTDE